MIRVAGNFLDDEVLASIEHAVENTGASLVVVLGHDRSDVIELAANARPRRRLGRHARPACARCSPGSNRRSSSRARRRASTDEDLVAPRGRDSTAPDSSTRCARAASCCAAPSTTASSRCSPASTTSRPATSAGWTSTIRTRRRTASPVAHATRRPRGHAAHDSGDHHASRARRRTGSTRTTTTTHGHGDHGHVGSDHGHAGSRLARPRCPRRSRRSQRSRRPRRPTETTTGTAPTTITAVTTTHGGHFEVEDAHGHDRRRTDGYVTPDPGHGSEHGLAPADAARRVRDHGARRRDHGHGQQFEAAEEGHDPRRGRERAIRSCNPIDGDRTVVDASRL